MDRQTKTIQLVGTESGAVKFDLSAFSVNGKTPTKFMILGAKWVCHGGGVHVFFDRSSPLTAMVLSGVGEWREPKIVDSGSGGTGDIQFSSLAGPTGVAPGYMIEMSVQAVV